jgi:hypothetical protein
MDTMKIRINLPVADALALGHTQHGRTTVAPSVDELGTMTAEQRAALASYVDTGREESPGMWFCSTVLDVTTPTWTGVLAALERLRLSRLAEAADEERKIVKLLYGTPVTDWYHVGNRPYMLPYVGGIDTGLCPDKRVRARRAEIEAGEYAVAFAAWREARVAEILARSDSAFAVTYTFDAEIEADSRIVARREAYRASCALAAEREAERRKAHAAVCRAYVIDRVPEYARAAEAGCDVTAHAEEHAMIAVRAAIEVCGSVVESYGCNDPCTVACPRDVAYGVHDHVQRVLRNMSMPSIIDPATSVISIARIDTCSHAACTAGMRVVVRVAVRLGHDDERELYVYADSAPPHECTCTDEDE